MNYDLVICGVGGQGVLTIAAVIDRAVHDAGMHLKQSEVHGMAQRGGAVSAFVRMSDQPVASDLIPDGGASLVISVEPLEALRYTRQLRPDGWIVTDVTPMINLDTYPDLSALFGVLFSVPRLVALDATRLASQAGTVKAQNVVVLGAAASQLPLSLDLLEQQVKALFAPKGERLVKANLNAFRLGHAASEFAAGLAAAGVASALVARLLPRMALQPEPVPAQWVQAWSQRLLADDSAQLVQQLLATDAIIEPSAVPQ